MAATIRELLGPEASIVHEIVTKEMGADSAIATHMVLRAALRSMPHTSSLPTASPPPLSPSPSPQPSLPHPLLVPYTCPLRTPASTRPPPGARGRRLHHQPAQPLRHPPVGVRHGQSGAPNQRGQRTARLQPHDGRFADRLLRTGAQRGQEAATILLQDARVALRRAVSEGPGRGHPRLVRAGRAYRDRFVFMPCM